MFLKLLGPMVFNTVKDRAAEIGGSALMLTEFGECNPNADHPDYQGKTKRSIDVIVMMPIDDR